jgi:hypothetical protein
MAAFNKVYAFVENLAEKVHNLGSDTLKIALSNTAPTTTSTVWSVGNFPAPAAANGYTAGGNTAAMSASAQSGGVYKLTLSDPTTWTATAGGIGPFQYAILYNDTSAGKEVIGWWDYGSAVTLASGETFTVDLDASNGVLTIT